VNKVYYSFIETAVFIKHIARKASLDIRDEIQEELFENPLRGAVVQGAGGVRKARIGDAQSNRGKRGSFRYLYLYLEHRGRIYLLYLYGKNEQDDLTAEQKKELKEIADLIKGGFYEKRN